MRDAKLAVETGVDGLDVVIGTSSFLREHSHGRDMAYIEKTAIEVIEYIKSKGLEVRCESIPVFSPSSTTPQLPISTPMLPRWRSRLCFLYTLSASPALELPSSDWSLC